MTTSCWIIKTNFLKLLRMLHILNPMINADLGDEINTCHVITGLYSILGILLFKVIVSIQNIKMYIFTYKYVLTYKICYIKYNKHIFYMYINYIYVYILYTYKYIVYKLLHILHINMYCCC